MKVKLFLSSNLSIRQEKITQLLEDNNITNPHPDLLFFDDQEKLGVEQAKKIRQFLSIKPNQAKGRTVVIVSAHNLTSDAQNALLKTLEEPAENTAIILGSEKESQLLPTILSRVEIEQLKSSEIRVQSDFTEEIQKLQDYSIEERFQFVEKLEEKDQFLLALTAFFHKNLKDNPNYLDFTKKLIKAEEWAASNGNIRTILEYLMLELPE